MTETKAKNNPPKNSSRVSVKALFWAILVFAPIFLTLGILKIYDYYLMHYVHSYQVLELGAGYAVPIGTSLDFYPYSGPHVQADFRSAFAGLRQADHEVHDELSIQSGDHGFFIDFDLENPPDKSPNEFRIFIIGGSAAQGWGGHVPNEEMYYMLLENKLNQEFGGIVDIRIINMTMGASITYQNYIALNKWGHALSPDLILSFSGRNDIVVTGRLMPGTDIPMLYENILGFVHASKFHNSPDWLKTIAWSFPGIIGRTNLGMFIRMASFYQHTQDALRKYTMSHEGSDFYGKHLYVHSLKSIKRDFEGIPMVVVIQPSADENPEYIEEFDKLGDYVSLELKEYMNDNWWFFDMHSDWKGNNLFPTLLVDPCHFSAEGHRKAASQIASRLVPVIEEILSEKDH